jgi:NAD(P)-dependent dehydrogenase (short-subunit alcohol dehydrogenase family)
VLPLDATDEASIIAAAAAAARLAPRLHLVVNCAGVLHDAARVGSIEDNRLGGWYAYRASKAAQNMYTRTLAVEWARSRRNVICVALHPGTTDTDLSRPFQANVPAGKLFGVDYAVARMLGVIDRLQSADSGQFFAWDGERIPW